MEDAWIGPIEGWRGGLRVRNRVGDRTERGGSGLWFGCELDATAGVERVVWVDDTGDGKDWRERRVEDGILHGERGLGTALPEASEEHEEETELGEKKHGPNARLREHVHRGAGSKDDGGESEEGEEEEDGPRFGEVLE